VLAQLVHFKPRQIWKYHQRRPSSPPPHPTPTCSVPPHRRARDVDKQQQCSEEISIAGPGTFSGSHVASSGVALNDGGRQSCNARASFSVNVEVRCGWVYSQSSLG
ncbi:MAG: hypothetical protein Q4A92_07655, partial [Corynebacterium sp.]|nr:hypothetical protein [Corynebacterium sp.]